jgi:hypothetical protein
MSRRISGISMMDEQEKAGISVEEQAGDNQELETTAEDERERDNEDLC